MPADVTRTGQVRAAVDDVTRHLGPVDLLVSNAGLREGAEATPWQADPADWWRVLETNLRGPFLLAHAVLPSMVARGTGRVLHVGSGMGHRRTPAGRRTRRRRRRSSRLTDSMAAALEGTGVTVLEASPGLVRTDMTETMWGPPDEQRVEPGAADGRPGPPVRPRRARRRCTAGSCMRPGTTSTRCSPGRRRVQAADARTLRLRPYGDDDPLG